MWKRKGSSTRLRRYLGTLKTQNSESTSFSPIALLCDHDSKMEIEINSIEKGLMTYLDEKEKQWTLTSNAVNENVHMQTANLARELMVEQYDLRAGEVI